MSSSANPFEISRLIVFTDGDNDQVPYSSYKSNTDPVYHGNSISAKLAPGRRRTIETYKTRGSFSRGRRCITSHCPTAREEDDGGGGTWRLESTVPNAEVPTVT